jgi:hypothetical protein
LFAGGINLVGMGVLGEYLWRALDEIRGRSLFLSEAEFGGVPTDSPVPTLTELAPDGMRGPVRESSFAKKYERAGSQ